MKNLYYGVMVVFTLVIVYIALNNLYMEGVNACIEKGNDIAFCEYHASK